MRKMFVVSGLLAITALAYAQAPQANQPAQGQSGSSTHIVNLDGEWTPIFVQMDGKKVEQKDFANVVIKNNVVTCKHDGKAKSFHLQFGPHNMIRCTMSSGDNTTASDKPGMHTHHGVYVAAQDYFCVSMNGGADKRSNVSTEETNGQAGKGQRQQPGAQAWQQRGPHACDTVIILHRTNAPSR